MVLAGHRGPPGAKYHPRDCFASGVLPDLDPAALPADWLRDLCGFEFSWDRGHGSDYGNHQSANGAGSESEKVERDYRYNPSVDNKILYSDVLLADGRHAEALDLFADDIDGPLKNNIDLLFTYAKILYTLERYQDALSYLERAEAVPNSDRIRQRTLLAALCLEELDRTEEADAKYQACQAGFMGEEARYRYGAFLEKTGDAARAQRCYQKTIDEAQYLDRRERRQERVGFNRPKLVSNVWPQRSPRDIEF